MQRLGILGGTFDPVHVGHVLLALFILERMPLDRVLFVPAADPPHKEMRPDMAPAEDRWAMVELAIAGLPCFQASRIELERPGKSYTYDTLRQLRAACPDSQLYLIIGGDNTSQLSTWHNPQGILELATVVAGSRLTADLASGSGMSRQIATIDTPLIQISSTQVRQRLARGQSVRYLVPERVEAYIREKGLYGAAVLS
jgi:nicotinate-nucleotide adenylyltransferase